MKDKFLIVETTNPEYRYIVEPKGYISITRHISEIAEFLKIRNYKGKVVFDNGLITGDTVGRFVEAYFNGKTFDPSSFITMFNVPEDIKEIADKALEEIKNSITKPPEPPKSAKKTPSKSTEKKERPVRKASAKANQEKKTTEKVEKKEEKEETKKE